MEEKFAENLRKLRKRKGLTQNQLAERLSITNKAVSKWETGEAMPDTALLIPLSDLLGVSVDTLLRGSIEDVSFAEEAESLSAFTSEPPRTETPAEEPIRAETPAEEPPRTETPAEEPPRTEVHTESEEAPHTASAESASRAEGAAEPEPHGERRREESEMPGETPKRGDHPIEKMLTGCLMLGSVLVYLLLGFLGYGWHPWWAIIPIAAMGCGIINCAFNIAFRRIDKDDDDEDDAPTKHPVTDGVCGIIMCSCCILYFIAGAFCNGWHPWWVIVVMGGITCGIVSCIGNAISESKKIANRVVAIVLAVILLGLFAATASLLFLKDRSSVGCSWNAFSRYTYENSELYSPMQAHELIFTEEQTSALQEIDLHWISGNVTLSFTEEASALSVREDYTADDELQLYYYLEERSEGSVLYIRFAKSGILYKNPEKTVTVTLPYVAMDLIVLDTVSAEVTVENATCKTLDVTNVSGNVRLQNCTAEKLSCSNVSGNTTADCPLVSKSAAFNSVSGNISFTVQNMPLPLSVSMKSVSGILTLSLPQEADVSFDVSTLSGSILNDWGATDLETVYRLETLSGNIRISKNT